MGYVGRGTNTQVLSDHTGGTLPNFQTISSTGAITQIKPQIFTSSGTYTPTIGMKYIQCICVGGGGGGGGTANAAASTLTTGGCGGGGATSYIILSAASIGASQAVTIGAGGTAGASGNNAGGNGGTTSLGILCTAPGGSGGPGSAGSGAVTGGAGGIAGVGDFSMPGQNGGSVNQTSTINFVPDGGNSLFGFGGQNDWVHPSPNAGFPGKNYGGGACGGGSFNGNGAAAGAVGAPGIVIITEYIST